MGRDRLRTLGLGAALVAVIALPLGIWAATSLSEEESGDLDVEVAPSTVDGDFDLIVSIPSDLNTPETTDGAETVGLVCSDATAKELFRVEHPFPFTETDGGAVPPHVHQRVSPRQLQAIEGCRLDGTTLRLEALLQTGP